MKTTNLIVATLLCAMFVAPSCKKDKNRTTETVNRTMMADNSKNSLDWTGTYAGVIPCADCEGIQTTLTLKNDNTYEMRTFYMGKEDVGGAVASGTFTWNDEGNKITLSGSDTKYLVGEDKLIQLDMDGNRIKSEFANNYNLSKVSDVLEKYWKLTSLGEYTVAKQAEFTTEPHMILKMNNNEVNGNGGCNSFHGSYVIEYDNHISFNRLVSTMMACPEMETESRFLKVLEEAKKYSLDGEDLVLKDKNNKTIARFEAVYM